MFPVPDQKAIRLDKLLVEHGIPLFRRPEFHLSDRGTNCDSLSENPTCLHFPRIYFYDFLLSAGKHQWAVKVSALSGKYF